MKKNIKRAKKAAARKERGKLKDIVEFLALAVADVENLVASFKEMDEDSSGKFQSQSSLTLSRKSGTFLATNYLNS